MVIAYERFSRLILSDSFLILLLTSVSVSPFISTTKISVGSPCKKSKFLEKPKDCFAWVIIIFPICSTAAGPSSRVATVASIDSIKSLKCKIANPTYLGNGSRFSFALVTAAKVPSAPTIILTRFNLLEFGCTISRLYTPTLLLTLEYLAFISL